MVLLEDLRVKVTLGEFKNMLELCGFAMLRWIRNDLDKVRGTLDTFAYIFRI